MAESEKPAIRLSKAAKEFNIGLSTIVEFLAKKGFHIASNPNDKLSPEMYDLLDREFQAQKSVKEEAKKIGLDYSSHQTISIEDKKVKEKKRETEDEIDEVFITQLSMSRKGKAIDQVQIVDSDEKETLKKTGKTKVPVVGKSSVKAADKEETAAEVVDKKTSAKKGRTEKETEADKIETADKIKDIEKEGKKSIQPKILGKIDLDKMNMLTKPKRKTAQEKKEEREEKTRDKKKVSRKGKPGLENEAITKPAHSRRIDEGEEKTEIIATEKEPVNPNFIKTRFEKLEGPKILDKIELPAEKKKTDKKPVASSKDPDMSSRKKKRRRIRKKPDQTELQAKDKRSQEPEKKHIHQRFKDKRVRKERERPEITEGDIQQQIKETLAKLTGVGKSKASKYRREKRQTISHLKQKELDKIEEQKNVIKVTEFVTANELASMMNVQVNQIISTCMTLGTFCVNQPKA